MIYVGTFLGRRHESPAACTGFAENKQFATATTGRPFYLEVGQMEEPAGAGVKLTIPCRGESRGISRSPSRWPSGWPNARPEPQAVMSRPCLKRTRSNREC